MSERIPIAVLVPCYNEELTVGKVVDDKIFITIHGTLSEDETIEFHAYEHATGQILPIDETIAFQGQCLGSLSSPMPLHTQSVVTIVNSVSQHQDTERIYTTDGKRIDRLQKGVNIVVGADGTVRKTVVSKK